MSKTLPEILEKVIGENMGCYYREATSQWLREITNPHSHNYSHLADMTAEVKGTAKAIAKELMGIIGEDELARGFVDPKRSKLLYRNQLRAEQKKRLEEWLHG